MNKIYNSIFFSKGLCNVNSSHSKPTTRNQKLVVPVTLQTRTIEKKKLEVAPAVKLFKPLCVPHFPHGTASTKIRETANLTSADKFNCRIYKISKCRCKNVIVVHRGRQNNNMVYYRLSHDAVP